TPPPTATMTASPTRVPPTFTAPPSVTPSATASVTPAIAAMTVTAADTASPVPPPPTLRPTQPPVTIVYATSVAVLTPGGTPFVPRTQDEAELVYYTPSAVINPLPVVAQQPVVTLPLLPFNTDFEGASAPQGAQEVVAPAGWLAWWRTGGIDCGLYQQLGTAGPCPALEYPGLEYRRPEFSVIPLAQQWLDPPRIQSGTQAARFFCTYGICMAGYVQRVQVMPGLAYVLGAWAHSWCTDDSSDHAHSQLETRDAWLNCEVAVGLDPTGGLDPFSPAVVWQAASIYDTYAYLATPPVTAQASAMTLYLRGRSLWGLRHNDFHFDGVTFAPS
ncbi:MAG: hypothetical protein JW910_23610, partial [Anaerolineae bacterium]|nr:hypothetical protein [Anaerolineae bacterium]